MPITVAEYLGQRTDINGTLTVPAQGAHPRCPFMDDRCSKWNQGYRPVCSVRKTDGSMWIVCRHRLCSTKKTIPLTEYQRGILHLVAKCIYFPAITRAQIIVRREVPIPIQASQSNYMADYVMRTHGVTHGGRTIPPVVLEMQGGGETSSTGKLTRHVLGWEEGTRHRAVDLATPIDGVGTIETNAWRRQQEQFLVKGNVASQTGASIVFCVGSLLFDRLHEVVRNAGLNDLRDHNWTLALIGFAEDSRQAAIPGPIPLKIDTNRLLFTNYAAFVRALTDQGAPVPGMILGEFESLSGETVDLPTPR